MTALKTVLNNGHVHHEQTYHSSLCVKRRILLNMWGGAPLLAQEEPEERPQIKEQRVFKEGKNQEV